MTNANVDAAVQGNSGRDLTLSYKGGSLKVTVPPDVPVVTIVPADSPTSNREWPCSCRPRQARWHFEHPVHRRQKDGVAPPM